jgi:hypothetical protein
MARPKRRLARSASLRTWAPGVFSFHGLPFLRGGVTGARVKGAVRSHGVDGLIFGNLIKKRRQHGGVTDAAAGHFDSPDLQRVGVDAKVNLAPLARFRRSMLARAPFAVAGDLDPGAVDQEMQRALGRAIADRHVELFLAAA